jgi:curved DNA-binding protein CbpA
MITNYYEILGVEKTATADSIKTAFRDKARKHHPDMHNNSVASTILFRIVFSAYSVLRDEASRRSYDVYLERSSVFGRSNRPIERPGVDPQNRMLPDPTDALSLAFDHLNYLLWEIEDILSSLRISESNDKKSTAEGDIIEMLTRIDEQVLTIAGFPDYFYMARKMTAPHANDRFQRDWAHRPFVSAEDYFYNIRNRTNELIRRTQPSDVTSMQEIDGMNIIERLFGIYNDAVRRIGIIRENGV